MIGIQQTMNWVDDEHIWSDFDNLPTHKGEIGWWKYDPNNKEMESTEKEFWMK